MKVFLDTNVLVSAFATRGLCADVLRHVLAEHELLVGEVVLGELRRVLRTKIRLPRETIDAVERLLGDQTVVAKPARPSAIDIQDRSDRWILSSAITGGADVLVTGDRDLLRITDLADIPIVDPRGFWSLVRG